MYWGVKKTGSLFISKLQIKLPKQTALPCFPKAQGGGGGEHCYLPFLPGRGTGTAQCSYLLTKPSSTSLLWFNYCVGGWWMQPDNQDYSPTHLSNLDLENVRLTTLNA